MTDTPKLTREQRIEVAKQKRAAELKELSGGYKFAQFGNVFEFAWPAWEAEVRLTGLHSDQSGTYGLMACRSTANGSARMVSWGNIKLESGKARNDITRAAMAADDATPWEGMIDLACWQTCISYLAGEPSTGLDDVKESTLPAYYMYPFLEAGTTNILYGHQATMKSYMALAIAIAAATGFALPYNIRAATRTNVLYLDWESDAQQLKRRYDALRMGMIMQGWEMENEKLPLFYRKHIRPIAADQAAIANDIKQKKIGLIVIDSIGAAVGGRINDADQAVAAMQSVQDFGVTSLILGHVPKSTNRQGGTTGPVGSLYFSALARNTWEVTLPEAQPVPPKDGKLWQSDVALYRRKSNNTPDTPDPYMFRLSFTNRYDPNNLNQRYLDAVELTGTGTASIEGEAVQVDTVMERIRNAITDAGQLDSASAVKRAGVTYASGYQAIRRLEKLGAITVAKKGGGRGNPTIWQANPQEDMEAE